MIPQGSVLIAGLKDYRIDRQGRVWSCLKPGGAFGGVKRTGKWKQITIYFGKTGHDYGRVNIQGTPRLVHRLVLAAFVGPCPKGMEARHFPDRSRRNNKVSNLKYGTRLQNIHDRIFHGTDNRGSRSGTAKLTWKQVNEIRELHNRGELQKDIAIKYGVSGVWGIVHDLSWKKEWR